MSLSSPVVDERILQGPFAQIICCVCWGLEGGLSLSETRCCELQVHLVYSSVQ